MAVTSDPNLNLHKQYFKEVINKIIEENATYDLEQFLNGIDNEVYGPALLNFIHGSLDFILSLCITYKGKTITFGDFFNKDEPYVYHILSMNFIHQIVYLENRFGIPWHKCPMETYIEATRIPLSRVLDNLPDDVSRKFENTIRQQKSRSNRTNKETTIELKKFQKQAYAHEESDNGFLYRVSAKANVEVIDYWKIRSLFRIKLMYNLFVKHFPKKQAEELSLMFSYQYFYELKFPIPHRQRDSYKEEIIPRKTWVTMFRKYKGSQPLLGETLFETIPREEIIKTYNSSIMLLAGALLKDTELPLRIDDYFKSIP